MKSVLVIPREITREWTNKGNLYVFFNGMLLIEGKSCDYEIVANAVEFHLNVNERDVAVLALLEKSFPKITFKYDKNSGWQCISTSNQKAKIIVLPGGQAFKVGKPKFVGKYVEEPKNNDGRQSCFWCGAPTKKRQGFSAMYDICSACGK
jgi:hypothetical protein